MSAIAIHFGAGDHSRMSTPGRTPKKSGRKSRKLIGVLIRGLGGSDVEIRIRDLLARLPEANVRENGADTREEARDRQAITAMRGVLMPFRRASICDFRGKSEDVIRSVGIGIGIGLLSWSEKDALARVVSDQHAEQPCEDAEGGNRSAPAKPVVAHCQSDRSPSQRISAAEAKD